jgi:hypothetical protein
VYDPWIWMAEVFDFFPLAKIHLVQRRGLRSNKMGWINPAARGGSLNEQLRSRNNGTTGVGANKRAPSTGNMSMAVVLPPKGRDLRLNFFRGIANWWIFLDHVPHNVVNWLTRAKWV